MSSTAYRFESLTLRVIAVPGSQYYLECLRAYVPNANVILLRHPSEFFRADPDAFDAMLYPAELGAASTLMYPEYAVAIPHPDVVRMSVAYAVATNWVAVEQPAEAQ